MSTLDLPVSNEEFRAIVTDVGEAVWYQLRKFRDYHHPDRCRTSPQRAISFVLRGADVGSCNPDCIDLFLAVLWRFAGELRFRQASNRAAYAAEWTGKRAQDELRRMSVAGYGVGKPERTDGVNGRILAALPSDVDPRMLGWMLRDAARACPVPVDGWNYDEFAQLLSRQRAQLDYLEAQAEARRQVRVVRETARQVAGIEWDRDRFDVPRDHRRATYQAIPIWSGSREDGSGLELVDQPPELGSAEPWMGEALQTAFADEIVAVEPIAALRAACLRINPAVDPALLTRMSLMPQTVCMIRDLVVEEVGIDQQTHRLTYLPGTTEINAIVSRRCGAHRALSKSLMTKVVAELCAMAAPLAA